MKLAILSLAILGVGASLHAARPNIVVFLVDDFGYECVGVNGGTSYQTPNLDKLAAGGVRFTHGYSQPLCTPTRVQLMTGLSNVRNYTHFGQLEPSQTTFAHLFREAGYSTCVVGKWQLGGGLEGPAHFGFDEYCLWQLARRPPRYANPGIEVNGKEVDYTQGEYGPDIINQYAREFIARHKGADKPFLLYYPMILTHDPFQPTPDSPNWDPKVDNERAMRDVKHFADMTAYMDKMVGKVVAALEDAALRDNTLILLIGDNGTQTTVVSRMGGRTVKGGKGSTKDNGIHVPLIANWPAANAGGRVCDDLVDTTDFLPTMVEAAGIQMPSSLACDGRSFLPQIRGEAGKPKDWIYCWYARDGGAETKHEFAFDQRFKLYRDGRFFEFAADLDEQKPLGQEGLSPAAAAARVKLAGALAQFANARPPQMAAQGGNGTGEGEGAGAAPKKGKQARKGKAAKAG